MNTDLAAQKALDRLVKVGDGALTSTEKTLATTWLFEAGVSNSGFARYFASSRADLAFNAPAALRAIGALQMAEIAAEANAVFGPGGPPRNRAERRAIVATLPEEARRTFATLEVRFFRCSEDIDELLDRFLARQGGPA
ncbi:MAG TPA: DMP19 family protein [Opitutaceae bacterium]